MAGGNDWGLRGSAIGLLTLAVGLVYLWAMNTRLQDRVDLLSVDLDNLRSEIGLVEADAVTAGLQGVSEKGRSRLAPMRKGLISADREVVGHGQIVNVEGAVAKSPFELATAEKKSKSGRYSSRIRSDLEGYATEHSVPMVSVDEAMLIIEAWAEDRRFYKDSVQSGDLSKGEARDETRAGLGEVQEQLRIIFGDYHYAALDETISFLSRLPGAREASDKEP